MPFFIRWRGSCRSLALTKMESWPPKHFPPRLLLCVYTGNRRGEGNRREQRSMRRLRWVRIWIFSELKFHRLFRDRVGPEIGVAGRTSSK
ncbi:hypothetical protein EYF80_034366 [Liparis tanakae]|uniref:Uncharacterized protein n=1 Tax=Liparis tanakae TaxID=230148 RepID=A0A4Z2GPL7_9TELE|nr:hypothetical protein EYF80_034366 [Liparis tanakae]